MKRGLSAFTLLELLVGNIVAVALFFAATTVVRNYNQIIARNIGLAELNGYQSIVESYITRLANNAGYQDFNNGFGNHSGCYLNVTPTKFTAAYDTLLGLRERVNLEFLATGGTYRGFDVGNYVIEFSIDEWDTSSSVFVPRNGGMGPLVDQVEGFYVSTSPSACNPELVVIGVLMRSREPIFRSAHNQAFSSDYFNVQSVNSAHIFSYNEFLIAPKNVILR